MKTNPIFSRRLAFSLVLSTLLGGGTLRALAADEAPVKSAVSAPANLSYELAQVLKMHEAGINEKVLSAYVENSKYVVAPKAEEIVLLRDRGVPDPVILAAIQKTQRPDQPAAQPVPVYTPPVPSPSPSYPVPASQPTVIYTQPSTVYVQSAPVYVPSPVVSAGYGYYDYGYYNYNYGCRTFPFQPVYYGLAYNYSHYPRFYAGFGGVSVGFRFGGGGSGGGGHFHHR